VLLVALAAHQLVRVQRDGLSPWSGGGFGMFSTTDVWGDRRIALVVQRGGVRRTLEPPPALREDVRRVLALPSDARLRALADEIAQLPTPDEGELERVTVQVFARNYAHDGLASGWRLLRGVEIDGTTAGGRE